MRRTARITAASVLAAGLLTALTAVPATAAGWQYEATYPTKSECYYAGQAGVGQQWDEFRCEPRIDPLSTGAQGGGWDLWSMTWVG